MIVSNEQAGQQGARDALSALKQFAQAAQSRAVEHCELCGATVESFHPHLLEPSSRKIDCACNACAILFSGRAGGRYLRIPQRVRMLAGFSLSDLEWAELSLPIQLAFFYRSAEDRLVAAYPSPAGAIESELPLDSLQQVFSQRAELRNLEPLVEALLVNRVGSAHSYFIAPIDDCFRLVGLIRMKWRGLSGGAEVWSAIAGFFNELQQRTSHAAREHHA